MEKNFSRREFLKSSFLGLGVAVLATSPLKIFAQSTSTSNIQKAQSNQGVANILYKQARELFYQKKYNESATLYHQLISDYPSKIIYYDGYARVLGAQQKALEMAELFRLGLQRNENNPYFMHRLSLSIRNLCTGNRKDELLFVSKYSENNLYNFSAELLLQAYSIKKIKGFAYDLKDFTDILDKRNKALTEQGYEPIQLSETVINKIGIAIAGNETAWAKTRKSRKPKMDSNVETFIQKINSRKRRDLYTDKEKELRLKHLNKKRKEAWKNKLVESIQNNRVNAVDTFAMLLLAEDFNDTDTIGKVRKFYKKSKNYVRLNVLNRFLYNKNKSLNNALALASTLTKYSIGNLALTEASQLIETVTPYINTIPTANIGSYYITKAQIKVKQSKINEAQNVLLEGIARLNGVGGISYALMESYALTTINKDIQTGIGIMKALCNKETVDLELPVWKYVKAYKGWAKGVEQAISEKKKPLVALAKLQKKAGSPEYLATINEIADLDAKLRI